MVRSRDPQELVDAAVGGDRASMARLLSLVERGGQPARDVGALTYPRGGNAYTVGITGAPGAGKSTLTNRLIETVRKQDLEVGVLAIDPSSPFTGGAFLGDRVRMQDHALDAGVFIRSMATRGHLGGLALATPQAIRVLDAAGLPVGARRDRRHRAGRGRDRRRGRHDGRRREPGLGRRRPGEQGRTDRGRRHLRHQQGRPSGRRADPTRPRGRPRLRHEGAAPAGDRQDVGVERRRRRGAVAGDRRPPRVARVLGRAGAPPAPTASTASCARSLSAGWRRRPTPSTSPSSTTRCSPVASTRTPPPTRSSRSSNDRPVRACGASRRRGRPRPPRPAEDERAVDGSCSGSWPTRPPI